MTRDDVRRIVGYVRVSTEEQGRSGAGLTAQRARIAEEAERRGWEVVAIYEDVTSGKSTNGRPGLHQALQDLADRKADALVAAKWDRLTRSTVDAAKILKLAQRHRWAVVVLDMDIDTTTAAGWLSANNLIGIGEFESRRIGERTREALAVKRDVEGVRLGNERKIPPDVERRIVKRRKKGLSFTAIAAELEGDGVPNPSGKPWRWWTVQQSLRRNMHEAVRTRRRRVELG